MGLFLIIFIREDRTGLINRDHLTSIETGVGIFGFGVRIKYFLFLEK